MKVLGPDDFIFVRNHPTMNEARGLLKQLIPNKDKVKAKVYEWKTGKDIEDVLSDILNA